MTSETIVKKNEKETIERMEDSELFKTRFQRIREDKQDSPYIKETLRVLPVGGYRSAIGFF